MRPKGHGLKSQGFVTCSQPLAERAERQTRFSSCESRRQGPELGLPPLLLAPPPQPPQPPQPPR